MGEKEHLVIEPATEADLDELSEMLGGLFTQEGDFRPDKEKQLRGLRLIFEQPSRGRVFVLRRNGAIVGMINLLFTISTAEGGFVILLEDLVIHKQYQGKGYAPNNICRGGYSDFCGYFYQNNWTAFVA
jgi:RimJ/RimL family protein N-acetyltransferase